MDYDPDIPLSVEEHSPTPIISSQPPLTSITPMNDSQTVSASGDSLPNRSATRSVLNRRYPLHERHLPDRYHKELYTFIYKMKITVYIVISEQHKNFYNFTS